MFQHLDDPVGFRPDPGRRESVARRGRQIRRRRRLGALAGGLSAALVLAGVSGALYVRGLDADLDRTEITEAPSLDGAINVLLVGTDSRPGLDDGPGSLRADTVVVVRLRPDGTVGVLSLPRDLIVPATDERLSASAAGGAQGVVDAVVSLGVPVDHYVQVGFPDLATLVDDLGGLHLRVDAPLRDEQAGLDLAPSACATVDGDTAVALLRARRVEGDPTGDLGRMGRGRAVITAAIAQLADLGTDVGTLRQAVDTLAGTVTVDDELGVDDMVDLARHLAEAGPGRVQPAELPVTAGFDDDGGAFLTAGGDAPAVLALFGAPAPDTDPPAPPPSTGTGTGTVPPPLGPC